MMPAERPGERRRRAAVRVLRLSGRPWVAAVTVLLGVLVVGQLRGQSGVPGLSGLSAAELTQLIANLTTENDRLRTEIATLATQRGEIQAAHDRGDTTIDQLHGDLARIRAWAGLDAVTGQGIAVTIRGPIGGDGVQDLVNELRNAGAEAIAVDGVRMVVGSVVAGTPSGLSVENHAIGDVFEIRAIGNPQLLTGTLNRTGGVVAQVGTAYPDASLTVSPVDLMTLAATDRDLTPSHAAPRL